MSWIEYRPKVLTGTSRLATPFDDLAEWMTLPSASITATAKGAEVSDSASTEIDFALAGTNSSSGSSFSPD